MHSVGNEWISLLSHSLPVLVYLARPHDVIHICAGYSAQGMYKLMFYIQILYRNNGFDNTDEGLEDGLKHAMPMGNDYGAEFLAEKVIIH